MYVVEVRQFEVNAGVHTYGTKLLHVTRYYNIYTMLQMHVWICRSMISEVT